LDWESGRQIEWASGRFEGTAPDVKALLAAGRLISGAEVELIAIDMPVATIPFVGRRVADDAVSKAFGAQGCSTHSPSTQRPGELGSRFMEDLKYFGYPLATANGVVGTLHRTIEVYPHPAILSLVESSYRIPYKVGKSSAYWPGVGRDNRILNLLEEFGRIEAALSSALGHTGILLPQSSEVKKLNMLKCYEDALDALVCAWVAIQYISGFATAYGDDTAAIWVPCRSS
jgi:predicted RNase H-like nuclease